MLELIIISLIGIVIIGGLLIFRMIYQPEITITDELIIIHYNGHTEYKEVRKELIIKYKK